MVNPSNESHTRAARDVVMASYASIAQSTIALRVFRQAPSLDLFLPRRSPFLPFVLCIIDRIRRRHLTPRRHFLNRRSQQPFRSQRSNQTEDDLVARLPRQEMGHGRNASAGSGRDRDFFRSGSNHFRQGRPNPNWRIRGDINFFITARRRPTSLVYTRP